MKSSFLALALLSLGGSGIAWDNPFPEGAVISPGIKLGYTFGEGFTWGLETSVLVRTGPALSGLLAHGPVLNLTWTPKHFHTRMGYEIVSWFAGIEAGPAWVTGPEGSRFGFGVTPWAGFWYVVPYYSQTLLPGEDLKEVGTYFKLPLCAGCRSSRRGHDFDWEDYD